MDRRSQKADHRCLLNPQLVVLRSLRKRIVLATICSKRGGPTLRGACVAQRSVSTQICPSEPKCPSPLKLGHSIVIVDAIALVASTTPAGRTSQQKHLEILANCRSEHQCC
jgi:hypothetical protein